MSTRNLRGPLQFNSTKTVLSGDYTVVNESVVVVNKTVGAATAVTLPASSIASDARRRVIFVVDGKGDSGTNNITVTRAGTDTINGATTYVLSVNYGIVMLVDCGSGVWQASTLTAPGQAQTITNGTITNLTATNGTITNETVTNSTVSGLITESDVVSVNAAGSVIGNATALTHTGNVVAGADDAKGVVLPTPAAGKRMWVYSSQAGNGLKCYPPVNGTINDGSANAAIVLEGKTRADFIGTSATNWSAAYTVNT